MKQVIATALLAVLPVSFAAKPPAKPTAPADAVIKLEPGPANDGNFATWALANRWYIAGRYSCGHQELFGFWPDKPTCSGGIHLQRKPADDATVRWQEHQAYLINRGQLEGLLRVSGESGSAEDIFNLLQEHETSILEIEEAIVSLGNFQELAEAAYLPALNAESAVITNKKVNIALGALAALAVLAGGLVALARAVRYVKAKTPVVVEGITHGVAQGINKVAREAQRRQIRRVVVDETIRQTTRNALAEISEDEKAALRTQIKQALDSGNHELATSLMSVLVKLEGK